MQQAAPNESIDLQAYLERIGVRTPVTPNLSLLVIPAKAGIHSLSQSWK
jgi:hypothetical protein